MVNDYATTQHSTLTSWARAILAAMAAAGHDTSQALRRAGLDPTLIELPEARYPLDGMSKLWEWAYAQYGEGVGLAVSRHVQPGNWQMLGLTLMASTSMQVMLERIRRYSMLVSDAVQIDHYVSGEYVRVEAKYIDSVPFEAERTEAFVAAAMRLGQVLQPQMRPVIVELTRAKPADPKRWYQAFGLVSEQGGMSQSSDITWSQPVIATVFDRALIGQPLPNADAQLARLHDQTLKQYLARFEQETLVQRVRQLIVEKLPTGEPDISELAGELAMSGRTLQRKLHDESTSYRQLLDDIRCALAKDYLSAGGYGAAEAAYLLGFSDQSNFTKAFKRWTGLTPGKYTQKYTQNIHSE